MQTGFPAFSIEVTSSVSGSFLLVFCFVQVCVCVRVCAYVETIQSETLNSDKQGSDLPVNRAMLGLEAQPAACVIAL